MRQCSGRGIKTWERQSMSIVGLVVGGRQSRVLRRMTGPHKILQRIYCTAFVVGNSEEEGMIMPLFSETSQISYPFLCFLFWKAWVLHSTKASPQTPYNGEQTTPAPKTETRCAYQQVSPFLGMGELQSSTSPWSRWRKQIHVKPRSGVQLPHWLLCSPGKYSIEQQFQRSTASQSPSFVQYCSFEQYGTGYRWLSMRYVVVCGV